jgi:hypothetical protein
MEARLYRRDDQIADELLPLAKDIVSCFKKEMKVQESIEYLVQHKSPTLSADFDTNDNLFLDLLRNIMWDELYKHDRATGILQGYSFVLSRLRNKATAKGEKQFFLTHFREKEPWVYDWLPTEVR